MIHPIIMPKLGETMEEGTLTKWFKKEGEKVVKGEPLFEVTTDKASFEQEATASGFLRGVIGQVGQTIRVTETIGYIADAMDEKLPDAADARSEGHGQTAVATPAPRPSAAAAEPQRMSTVVPSGRVKASPLARKLAAQRGVDLTSLRGSGPGGRIVAADVPLVGAESPAAGRASRSPESKPLSGIRKTIAARLAHSKQTIPHFYLQTAINMQRIVPVREHLNAKLAAKGVKVTFNDLIVKAAALALERYPGMNALLEDDVLTTHYDVHIGIAVSLEEGLVVPVIRHANRKDVVAIARESRALIEKAHAGRLTPDDMAGGTFTISNLGMFAIESFQAIINPPQVGILAIGTVTETVVSVGGAMDSVPVMKVNLSADHRAVDGAYGAKFLMEFKDLLENPYQLFAGML
jgi:pyruvate dehydrogenase E2 component (dihydrolipoamide acetyltransferase)